MSFNFSKYPFLTEQKTKFTETVLFSCFNFCASVLFGSLNLSIVKTDGALQEISYSDRTIVNKGILDSDGLVIK